MVFRSDSDARQKYMSHFQLRSSIVRRRIENPRQWIGIDISPTACRVMAKRLRDVCTCRKANRSGAPDAASSSATCRGRWRNCASSRRLNLRTGPSSPSAASRTRCRSATWAGRRWPLRVNSIARWQPTAAESSLAAIWVARCVADFPANPFPNQPATAR